MIIKENRLKQIIREEVELRIVKQTISEVIVEMQLRLTQEQQLILEQSVLDAIKSAARKAAVPITVMAALAFGGQVASDVQQLDGVGVTPAAAEQIQNALDASQNMSDARADFIQNAIDASSREGEIPADLAKGVGADKAKNIAMDRLEAEFVSKGDVESTGKMQQTARGGVYLSLIHI